MPRDPTVGAVFCAFEPGITGSGARGDRAWLGACAARSGHILHEAAASDVARAPYIPGLLALREGPLLEDAVRALAEPPDVMLVNATGHDHPRGAGLALHLGAVLDIPTVGVTDRTLVAVTAEPPHVAGAASALRIGPAHVGYALRVRPHVRVLVVHAAWRTDPDTALAVVRGDLRSSSRTPEVMRRARHIARDARATALS